MTDVTGNTPSNASRGRKTGGAKPTGFAAVDQEARILESTAVQGGETTPDDLSPSQHGDISSPSASDQARARPEPTLSEEDSIAIAALEKARDRAMSLRDWATIRQEEARDAVRSHPLRSSALVFGGGVILGLLLARR